MEVIAFYLPQFHPIPENDEWWGPGFTEWTNVTRARPLFRGHVQPHLPGRPGLLRPARSRGPRAAQADLARRHGVTGFCYWHYWFAGRRLLERPFDEVLASGRPDFPFCLGWANQSWSGIWHGAPDRVLMRADLPRGRRRPRPLRVAADRRSTDPRYLRVDGRPVFFVHQPGGLPDAGPVRGPWQTMADDAGSPGPVPGGVAGPSPLYRSHVEDGFDAGVLPRSSLRPHSRDQGATGWATEQWPGPGPPSLPLPRCPVPTPRPGFGGLVYPCVYPNWDNTPRSGRRGVVARGATPERFGAHVRRALGLAARQPDGEQVVVVKSWNEWAEGNYLEPDQEYGQARLKVLDAEISRAPAIVHCLGRG